jgi:hypothetical protein
MKETTLELESETARGYRSRPGSRPYPECTTARTILMFRKSWHAVGF